MYSAVHNPGAGARAACRTSGLDVRLEAEAVAIADQVPNRVHRLVREDHGPALVGGAKHHLERPAEAGVAVIIQPGGSVRDGENIVRANELGVAMVFTGERHFLH